MSKILTLKKLDKILENYRKKRKKIVLCHGVFDLLHLGHINHFKEAKTKGDILVVTITKDRFVNKGPGRPLFKENSRAKILEALAYIDFVAINDWATSINTIKLLKPNIYFKGPDYKKNSNDITGNITKEKKAVELNGGKILYSTYETFSSSSLINKFTNIQNINQKQIINKINSKYSFNKILKIFEDIRKLNVLIIGESIIDEYVFCEALGKSGKESILTFKDEKKEKYLGGVLAIANHCLSFSKSIEIISYLGKDDGAKYIKNKTDKNIKVNFINKGNSPTLIKRRYLDQVNSNKIFGIYTLNDDSLNKQENSLLKKIIKAKIKKTDLVVVADYGHGLIDNELAEFICKNNKNISINAQINSANVGFHNIRKFNNFKNLIINANELRHTMRERKGNLENLAKKLKSEIKAENILVTSGKNGAMLLDKKNNIIKCPAFANEVVDKVGAGDAFLMIFSLILKTSKDLNLSMFAGSLAAAQSVKTMGNKNKIDKTILLKAIQYILK